MFLTHHTLCHVGHSIKNTPTRSTIGIWHLYVYHAGANMSIHTFQSLHMWLEMPGLMHYSFNSTCMHNTCRCKFCCLAVHVPCVRDLKILHHRLLSLNFINNIYEGQANMRRAKSAIRMWDMACINKKTCTVRTQILTFVFLLISPASLAGYEQEKYTK